MVGQLEGLIVYQKLCVGGSFFDILLQLFDSCVSQRVLSDVRSEVLKPLKRYLAPNGQDSVSESLIGWTLPL